MITELTKQENYVIAKLKETKRFTLALTEEVKNELKPVLSQPGTQLIFDFKNIEFIDSSGIGCIISLEQTAKRSRSAIKLCNLSKEVSEVMNLLHLPLILDIQKDVESCKKSFSV